MGAALHPVQRERIEAAALVLHDAHLELLEALVNGGDDPDTLASIGDLIERKGQEIADVSRLVQVRCETAVDDAACKTCREANGRHHVIECGKIIGIHVCEHLGEKSGMCRRRYVLA